MWRVVALLIIVEDFGLTMHPEAALLRISRPPKDYFPKSGSLQLICEAEGSPVPSVAWHDAQTMAVVHEEGSINLKLYKDIGLMVIHNPVEKEVYEFYCNASNGLSWITSSTVRTGLAFLSPVFHMQPIAIQVVQPSQTVQMTCRPPTGVPSPKVHWLKDGKLMSRKNFSKDFNRIFFVNKESSQGEQEQWSVRITMVSLMDSGLYRCVATNDYGRVESSGSWLVVANGSAVFGGIMIENRLIVKGQDVAFVCDGHYGKRVRWIASLDLLSNSRINTSASSLLIKEASLMDKGTYACESNGSQSQLLGIFRLNVKAVEVVDDKTRSRKKTVIEGVNVVLECDLENTQTEFYWETPNSQPIFPQDLSHSRIQVSNNGNLNIRSVQLSDSGKYTCNTHSSLDVAHKSIWLEVSKHQLDVYPVISVPCQNMTVLQGANINLRCEVIGEDIIKIIWYRGLNIKQRVSSGGRVSFPSKDSMRIAKADIKVDQNFYTCEAINDQGRKATWTSFVKVISSHQSIQNTKPTMDLPLPPVVESPKNIRSTSLELSWSSIGDRDKETFYWIEYVYFGSSTGWSIYKKNWKENHITIDNLLPDTWYQFLVRSKNDEGIGRASVPTEYVKTNRDDKLSGNIGFSFSKIHLHRPTLVNGRDTRLTWALNKVADDDRSSSQAQFYLVYRSVSILQCILSMSTGRDFDKDPERPSFTTYCSLRHLTSDKLRVIKEMQPYMNDSSAKIPIDFSKTNLTKITPLNLENYARIAWMLPPFPAFRCFNVSILSNKDFKTVQSNGRLLLTQERRPSLPPQKVHISWLYPEISININWQIPHISSWNGVLTGSNVYMKSNESEIVLKYNNSLPHKVIKRVNAEVDWVFQITLFNCAGESDKSPPLTLNRLTSSLGPLRPQDSVFKKSWMIATLIISSLLFWAMLCTLTVYLCCVRSKGARSRKHASGGNDHGCETAKGFFPKDNLNQHIGGNAETEKILQEGTDDKSSTNNCASSAKSSGQSSSPSSVSFCNPYASTQLFDGAHDAKFTDANLFYLTAPIFETLTANKPIPIPLNYYLSNVPEWVPNSIIPGPCQQNPKIFPFSFPGEYRRNSNDSEIGRALKEKANISECKNDDLSLSNANGAISSLLTSSAPFSDQFSFSSKGKSTPNSSTSDSTNHLTHTDPGLRYGVSNVYRKPTRRRQDRADQYDQSTEMIHLLVEQNDNSSPSVQQVYDVPYSESSVDSRRNSQSKD